MRKKLLLFAILLMPFMVKANSISIECPEKVNAGKNANCVVTGNATIEIQGIDAKIKLSDNLSFVSFTFDEFWQGVDVDDGRITPYTLSGDTITGNFNIGILTVKAKDNVYDKNESVRLINASFGTDNGDPSVEDCSDTIRIPSNDNTLRELSIDGITINPKFDPSTTKYTASTKNSSINVVAIPNDKNAKVSETGKVDLKNGKNEIDIKVTAEDGSTKTYTITITADISKPTTPDNPDKPIPGDKTDDSINTNVSTGDSFIYVIIAIGILAIVGMTVYYKKLTNKK